MSKMAMLQVFTADGVSYFVPPKIQAYADVKFDSLMQLIPVTVLSPDRTNTTESFLSTLASRLRSTDDVFSEIFLREALVTQNDMQLNGDACSNDQLGDTKGNLSVRTILRARAGNFIIPEGPYFLYGSQIHQAWRMYPDTLDWFATTVVAHEPQSIENPMFTPLAVMHDEGIWKNVAVPSRSYHAVSSDRPLAGQRIAIKDIYRLAGIKTTQTNHAWEATYGPETSTADFVQKLISLGAVIVGKTKMGAFASAEEPTDQFVDFHAPFNPRGDGYQTPAGSSNGAAAALSGYEWLDIAIGTDTSGSIRYPAAICGLYGLRYSSHTVSMRGIYPCCNELDTIGLLGRDLESFHRFSKLTVGPDVKDVFKYPKHILYPTDFLPYTEEPAQAVLEEFITQLEAFMGVKRKVFSIADEWEKCKPTEGNGKSLKEFLAKTRYYPFYYDGYNEYEAFRKDHRKKFDREPYVGPYMQWKWKTGSQVTLEQKEQSLKEMRIYRRWFEENILTSDDETASTAILLMSVSCYAPNYRDTIHKDPSSVLAFSEGYTASMLRLPQIVLPVGQVPYDSQATGRTEWHPITASLLGAQNSDLMLINLVRDTFKHANWSERLKVGREAWNIGPPPRNVHEETSHKL